MPKLTHVGFQNKIITLDKNLTTLFFESQRESEILFRLVFASLCPIKSHNTNKEIFARHITEKILEVFGINNIQQLIWDKPIVLSFTFDNADYDFSYIITSRSQYVKILEKPKKQIPNNHLHIVSRNYDLLTYSTSFLSLIDTYHSHFSYVDYFNLMEMSGLATKLKNPNTLASALNKQIENRLGGEIKLEQGCFYLKNAKTIPISLLSVEERELAEWSCLLQSINYGNQDILFLEKRTSSQLSKDIIAFLIQQDVQIIALE